MKTYEIMKTIVIYSYILHKPCLLEAQKKQSH